MASGMAIHKNGDKPTIQPDTVLIRSGPVLFNRGRNKADKVDIDRPTASLSLGLLCADGQYRQIVTEE